MIKVIESDQEAREFLNSVPYPEHVPDWLPINTVRSFVLGVYTDKLVGCFPLIKHDDAIEINVAFLPEHRGEFAVESARQAFEWIWGNTPFRRIIANIKLPHVERFAEKCGMVKSGNLYEVEHGQFC